MVLDMWKDFDNNSLDNVKDRHTPVKIIKQTPSPYMNYGDLIKPAR